MKKLANLIVACSLFITHTSFVFLKPFSSNADYELIIKSEKNYSVNGKRFIKLSVALKNNTPDTLKYVSMSCSWIDFYRVDSKKIILNKDSLECVKNVPVVLKLPPYSDRVFQFGLKVNESLIGQKISYRIGYNLATNVNEYVKKSIEGKSLDQVIIWSDEIKTTIE